jgi:hypothetical protein
MIRSEQQEQPMGEQLGRDREAIVFVTGSVEDACALWEQADSRGWMVVNVPDLRGAYAVIDKVRPALVVCDVEIEGPGSWRDLLAWRDGRAGFELMVAAREVDEALWTEVLLLGGTKVLEKPVVLAQLESAMGCG